MWMASVGHLGAAGMRSERIEQRDVDMRAAANIVNVMGAHALRISEYEVEGQDACGGGSRERRVQIGAGEERC